MEAKNPDNPLKRDYEDEILPVDNLLDESGELTPPTPSKQNQPKIVNYANTAEELGEAGSEILLINYDQANNTLFFPNTNNIDGQVKTIVAATEIPDKDNVSDVRSPQYNAGKQLHNCVVDTILDIFSKNSTKWTDAGFSDLLKHVCEQCYKNEELVNIVLGKPQQATVNFFPKGLASSIPNRSDSIQKLCKSGILNFLKFKYGKYSEDGSQEKIYFGNPTMRKKFDLFVKGFIKFLDAPTPTPTPTTSGTQLMRNRSIRGSEYRQPDADISIDQILMELLDLSFEVANGYDMMIMSELNKPPRDSSSSEDMTQDSSENETFEICKTGIKAKLVGDDILSYSEKFRQNGADAKVMTKKIGGYDLLHDLTLLINGLLAYDDCQTKNKSGTISQELCRNLQTKAIKDFCTKAGIRLPGYLYDPVRLTLREGYLVFFKILLSNNGGVINLTSVDGLRKDCYDESGRDLTAVMLGRYYDKLNEEEKDMFTTDCETYTNKQCSKEVATTYLKQFAENAKSKDPIIARKMKNTVIKNAVSLLDGCQKDKSDIRDNVEANCDIEVDDYIYKVASIRKGNKSYHFITVIKNTGVEGIVSGGGGGAAGGGGSGISPEAYFCFKGSITIDMLKIMSSQVCGLSRSVGNLRNAKGTNTGSLFMDVDGDFFNVSGIQKPADYNTNIASMRKYTSSPQYFKQEIGDNERELIWYFNKTICDLIWVCYTIGVITTTDDLVRRGILVKWLSGKFEMKNADGSFKSNNCPDCFRSVENGWSYQEGIRGIDKDSQSKYILEQVTGAAILINELFKINVIIDNYRNDLLRTISPYLPTTIAISELSSYRVANSLAFTYRGFDLLSRKLKFGKSNYERCIYLLLKAENLLINKKIQWYLNEILQITDVYGFYTLPKIDDIYRSPVAVIIDTNSNVNFIEEISAEFSDLQPKWFIVDNKDYSKLADNLNEDNITFALIVDVGDSGKLQKRIEELKKNGENIRFIISLPERKDTTNTSRTTNYRYIFTSQKTTELLSYISEYISIPSYQIQMIEAQKKNMFITTMESIDSDLTKYQTDEATKREINIIFSEIKNLMKISDGDIENNNILSAANDENTCDECYDSCDIDLGGGQLMEYSTTESGGGAGGGGQLMEYSSTESGGGAGGERFQGLGLISRSSRTDRKQGGLPMGGARPKNKTKKHYKKRHNTRKNKMTQRRNMINKTRRKLSYKSKQSRRRNHK